MMTFRRHWFCLLSVLTLVTSVQAQETAETASPDKRFHIHFHGSNPILPESFTIEDAKGTTLLDSKACPELVKIGTFFPEHVLWSPDSRTVAIVGGHSKLAETYLFTLRGNAFICVRVPNVTDGHDNPAVFPVKWLSGRRLILSITGPHAGKTRGYYYEGKATLHVPTTGIPEVHYRYLIDHDKAN
ncbi:MAG: hypothetical protein Q8M07_08975 [Prosthecobacter sp.]|nr:hypothetical protein [Prosthecobacter sp.]